MLYQLKSVCLHQENEELALNNARETTKINKDDFSIIVTC